MKYTESGLRKKPTGDGKTKFHASKGIKLPVSQRQENSSDYYNPAKHTGYNYSSITLPKAVPVAPETKQKGCETTLYNYSHLTSEI